MPLLNWTVRVLLVCQLLHCKMFFKSVIFYSVKLNEHYCHLNAVQICLFLTFPWPEGSGLFLMICNGQLIAYFACQKDPKYPTLHSYWPPGDGEETWREKASIFLVGRCMFYNLEWRTLQKIRHVSRNGVMPSNEFSFWGTDSRIWGLW